MICRNKDFESLILYYNTRVLWNICKILRYGFFFFNDRYKTSAKRGIDRYKVRAWVVFDIHENVFSFKRYFLLTENHIIRIQSEKCVCVCVCVRVRVYVCVERVWVFIKYLKWCNIRWKDKNISGKSMYTCKWWRNNCF